MIYAIIHYGRFYIVQILNVPDLTVEVRLLLASVSAVVATKGHPLALSARFLREQPRFSQFSLPQKSGFKQFLRATHHDLPHTINLAIMGSRDDISLLPQTVLTLLEKSTGLSSGMVKTIVTIAVTAIVLRFYLCSLRQGSDLKSGQRAT